MASIEDAAALSEDRAYTDLFSLTDESEMGHIRLAREADLVLPAASQFERTQLIATAAQRGNRGRARACPT